MAHKVKYVRLVGVNVPASQTMMDSTAISVLTDTTTSQSANPVSVMALDQLDVSVMSRLASVAADQTTVDATVASVLLASTTILPANNATVTRMAAQPLCATRTMAGASVKRILVDHAAIAVLLDSTDSRSAYRVGAVSWGDRLMIVTTPDSASASRTTLERLVTSVHLGSINTRIVSRATVTHTVLMECRVTSRQGNVTASRPMTD